MQSPVLSTLPRQRQVPRRNSDEQRPPPCGGPAPAGCTPSRFVGPQRRRPPYEHEEEARNTAANEDHKTYPIVAPNADGSFKVTWEQGTLLIDPPPTKPVRLNVTLLHEAHSQAEAARDFIRLLFWIFYGSCALGLAGLGYFLLQWGLHR